MRSGWLAASLLLPLFLAAQVRINELQCTRAAGTDGTGPNGDWVELVNLGRHAVDLAGYVLTVDGRTARLPSGVRIAPRTQEVIFCDGEAEQPANLPLKLPREGGSLLLVAPDGATVLDMFTWPALPPGVSIGRSGYGAVPWGFFTEPTPGAPNGRACARLTAAPQLLRAAPEIVLGGPPDAVIHFTLDGTPPGPASPLYQGPLLPAPGTVVQARAFAPGAVPSTTIMVAPHVPPMAWALSMAPADLLGSNGIADTTAGNFARKGRRWQRQAWLQRGDRMEPVGVAIAGSGSRSLPKRNLQLLVRDRFQGGAPLLLPDGTAWRTLVLRADATPHAFLRNIFMQEIARRSGARVDVQPWFLVPLQLNGCFQGYYRAMPSKGDEWLRSLSGGMPVQAIKESDLDPGGDLLSALGLNFADTLQHGLDEVLEVESLLELACFDLWTGRADHDINVRAWRPQQPQGRWRWVLYDLDLWAPPNDRTVMRMCGSKVLEVPFLPEILADPPLQARFLARFSALCATTLSPDKATAMADSLFTAYRPAMEADHARWHKEMFVPLPEGSHALLTGHIARRNGELFRQLTAKTGRQRVSIAVRVEPPNAGHVEVEHLFLTGDRRTMEAFAGVPLHVQAVAGEGMEFEGWEGAPGGLPQLVLAPDGNLRLTAVFRPLGLSRQGGL
ncbi:MAG: CotH kinase family protein [Flavobacteriales bacterium]|nr:CotH kinase family protein [Flavobacteriales bacterium]